MTKQSKVLLALAILWGAFILGNSALPGAQSTEISDAVVNRLPGLLAWLDIQALTVLVRKTAHVLEYALLGGLVAAVFWRSGGLRLSNMGNILLPCLLWAVGDEFLQTFIPGRTGLVRDVWIDFGGILLGAAVIWVVAWQRKLQRKPLRLHKSTSSKTF